jgi:hypothetical protein
MCTKAGAISAAYEKLCSLWNQELHSHFTSFYSHLHGKQDAREAERARRMKLSRRQREMEAFQSSQNDIFAKLRELGVHGMSEKDLFDDETKTPEEYALDCQERQLEDSMTGYELYERLGEMCQGVHGVEVLLGKSRIMISCTGMDVIDLLPRVETSESLLRVRRECEERERESRHREELMTSDFET